MAAKNDIPIDYLRESLIYEPGTGLLRWRERPLSHFPDKRAWRIWNAQWPGRTAGNLHPIHHYWKILFSGNGQRRHIRGHRAAWALTYGEYPPHDIDHWDGDPSNNRLSNLKAATQAENNQNTVARGTTLNIASGHYQARIGINRKLICLGTYDTEAAAHRVYLDAKKKLHLYRPVPR